MSNLDKIRRVSAPFRRSESILIKTLDTATKEKLTTWPKFKTVLNKQYGIGADAIEPGSKYKTRDNLNNAPNNSDGYSSTASSSTTTASSTSSPSSSATPSYSTTASSTSSSSSSATPSYTSNPSSGSSSSSATPSYSTTASSSTGGSSVTSGATSGGSYSSGSSSSSSAANSEYHCIDTRVFDRCIEQKDQFISRYAEIVSFYDEIVKKLGDNWEGRGANTFISDAKIVRTNITGISDILAHMCNTLEDCRSVIEDCDHSLEDLNRNPDSQE